jgi:predicted Fe-Mo cluster-binding NifX family protein
MQIAITTAAPSIDSEVDPRFGQAPYVVFVDTESGQWQAYVNPAPQMGGHGMIAARFVAMQGAQTVISGDFCPHSFAGLRSIGVGLFASVAKTTAAEAYESLQAGTLLTAVPRGGPHHGHLGHHAPAAHGAATGPDAAADETCAAADQPIPQAEPVRFYRA